MRKLHLKFFLATLLFLASFFNSSFGQTDHENLKATILEKDSLFWQVFNNCEMDKYKDYFTDNLEFYHDKGGLSIGLDDLVEKTKRNLCSNENFKLRREVVKGSIEVFPLKNGEVTYGAILSGQHVFYVWEKGKPEKLDGRAKFTHTWILIDGVWKMHRILSYDHGPANALKR